jgi:ADP-heptose:LPS heptosyltransferase
MNFPGLDPAWSGAHHAARALRFIGTWSIDEVRAQLAKDEKVLVVASTALGDSLLTTPLLSTLASHLGRERVSFLVKEPFAGLYQNDPRLHRVFTLAGKFRWGNLRDELQKDPHRIALLANFTEPDLVPFLWHAGVRGFLRYRSRWTRYPRWMANAAMLRRPGSAEYASGHAIENNLAMAEALGLEPSTHRLSMPQWIGTTPRSTRTVLIHPGASRPNKRWPVENWAKLADSLVDKLEVDILLTGDAGEKALGDEIVAHAKSRPSNVAGSMPLPALAQAQAGSAAFLSGDTGPYHLAVAVGCPTVTLFAPTDRGSSVEAVGPHQADPLFHRAISTANYGDSIATIPFERVLAELVDLIEKSIARKGSA